MNKVIEIGRATKDIELMATPSGTTIAPFSIAVRRNFKDANGNTESDFFECIAFGKLAETISKYIHKGDLFCVIGRLQTRSYTDKNGSNRKVTEIVVEDIEFLQNKREESVNDSKPEETDPFDGLPF